MPRGLLESLAARGRSTTLLLAAALLGGVGGAWAVADAPGLDGVTAVRTVADGSEAPSTQATGRPTDAGKPDKTPKPDKAGKPAATKKTEKPDKAARSAEPAKADGPQGAHGRCVSAVARSTATGGPNHNHGGAVSAAARSCPRPSPAQQRPADD
jgi:hypothetical protein